jgi:hypothetical protein
MCYRLTLYVLILHPRLRSVRLGSAEIAGDGENLTVSGIQDVFRHVIS